MWPWENPSCPYFICVVHTPKVHACAYVLLPATTPKVYACAYFLLPAPMPEVHACAYFLLPAPYLRFTHAHTFYLVHTPMVYACLCASTHPTNIYLRYAKYIFFCMLEYITGFGLQLRPPGNICTPQITSSGMTTATSHWSSFFGPP